mgnify:CR=1 FL=1
MRSRLVFDLENAPFPEKPLVPVIPVIHDRVTIEIMRGCLNGCRFCSAGMLYRPQRYRSVDKVVELARKGYDATGYDTVNLLSLSSSDHPDLLKMVERLTEEFSETDVGLSLPSLRVGDMLFELPKLLGENRKSGLTLAPEVATESMKGTINKNIPREEILNGAREAFKRGWRLVKLYFMVGLPGETADDYSAIVELADRISFLRKELGGGFGNVNAAISTFVPKPHTPFQWAAQISQQQERDIRRALLDERPLKSVRLKFDDPFFSALEGLFARGDRRVGEVLHAAWRKGARFDAWADQCKKDIWLEAMQECDVSFEFYCGRERSLGEVLPWDHLSYGIRREFLEEEWHRSRESKLTEICGKGACNACMTDILCPNRPQKGAVR